MHYITTPQFSASVHPISASQYTAVQRLSALYCSASVHFGVAPQCIIVQRSDYNIAALQCTIVSRQSLHYRAAPQCTLLQRLITLFPTPWVHYSAATQCTIVHCLCAELCSASGHHSGEHHYTIIAPQCVQGFTYCIYIVSCLITLFPTPHCTIVQLLSSLQCSASVHNIAALQYTIVNRLGTQLCSTSVHNSEAQQYTTVQRLSAQ